MSESKTLRTRVGNQMVVVEVSERDGDISITTRIESAIVLWSTLMARVEIILDEYENRTPWDDCDGYEHDLIEYDKDLHENSPHWFRQERGPRKVVVVTRETARDWGAYGRHGGVTRHEAYLRGEQSRLRAIRQLRDWYADGWSWHTAKLEYQGYESRVGGWLGNYCHHLDTETTEEARDTVAAEVASAMDDDGYEIIGRPSYDARACHRRGIAQGLGFDSYDAWKANLLQRRAMRLPKAGKQRRRRIVRLPAPVDQAGQKSKVS